MNITGPTLTVDKLQCKKNIQKMVEKAKKHEMTFRPHFTAHQSEQIGEWFREFGVDKITVSSVHMAEYFADHGWNDITIAFPLNMLEVDRIVELNKRITLNVLIQNTKVLRILSEALSEPIHVFIEIDTGQKRTGVSAAKDKKIEDLLELVVLHQDLIHFDGFLVHTGHSYQKKTRHGINNVHFDALLKLQKLKKKYSEFFPDMIVSLGDTPTCSICENYRGIDEIRPGRFIFNDVTQWKLGVCSKDEIAVRMICPIVSKHRSRNELVIHGGETHFSRSSITNVDGKALYGRILRIEEDDSRTLLSEMNYLHELAQDHGMIKVTPAEFLKFNVGDLIEIIPVHSGQVAYAMGWMTDLDGEIIETMPRRFRSSVN